MKSLRILFAKNGSNALENNNIVDSLISTQMSVELGNRQNIVRYLTAIHIADGCYASQPL
jgi:hypothetical protein